MIQRLNPHYPPCPQLQPPVQVPDSPWLQGHRKFPRAEPPVSLPKFPSAQLDLDQGSTASRKLFPGEANIASGGLYSLSRWCGSQAGQPGAASL